jgi:Uncharacterised nucleotidyltransferase
VSGEGRRRGSFWPSPTQRALLEVVLGSVEQAQPRWQALQPLDVTALEPGSFGLLPLLYERLTQIQPDEPQLPRLFGTYRSVWYRNQLFVDRLAVLLPLLRQRAQVDPFLVGGMSALLRWYPRLGLRPVPQVELMVDQEAAVDVVKVAGYAGWRPTQQTPMLTRLRDESGRLLVIHHGLPPSVAGPRRNDGLSLFSGRALELSEVEGSPVVLDAGDELLFTCALGARTIAVPSCQWLIDVHHLLRSGELPTAEEVLDRSTRLHLVAPLGATIAYLAEFCDPELTGKLLGRLDAQPTTRRDRLAFRLVGAEGRRAGPAQLLAVHLQATADEPFRRVVTRLPRTLQESWGARNLWQVSALSLKKVMRLVRPTSRASPAMRSDSASS